MRHLHVLATLALLLFPGQNAGSAPAAAPFRAGAASGDITPTQFPVIVNGGFLSKTADRANDPLHIRWLVLDDGRVRLALGVMDTCVIPAEFADAVKAEAVKQTGIPASRIMLSATHSHSTPSLMRCLGTDADPQYPAFVLPRVVETLRQAVDRLAPARAGWAVVAAPDHTHTRVWIRRPDRMLVDPFGETTVRANMHPGYENPDAIGPSGPSDPALTLLAIQAWDGKPLAALANYSMHYFGAPAVSADYYGLFAAKLGEYLGAPDSFVGIMSQGTSGDQHWMDYRHPKREVTMDRYASELARIAATAYQTATFSDSPSLAMQERTLQIPTRQPDAKRLAWARELLAKMGDRPPKDRPEVYAREQLWLVENPVRSVKLQAIRIGGFGIAVWPCEVFALSGLKIKAQSPLQPVMNIELANAEEGYIPPPELHPLGGYNTWACRSASLEPGAEPQIVDALLGLLEEVSGKPRQAVAVSNGAYPRAVLEAKPLAYWRLEEWSGPTATDATASQLTARYEPGIARWLDGPDSTAFSGDGHINRCPHLAGGRLRAEARGLGTDYSIEFWLWNGLATDARPVTGCLFARGNGGGPVSDLLSIGGREQAEQAGRLVFSSGKTGHAVLAGRSDLGLRKWRHVVLVRDGRTASAYLDGKLEISGEIDSAAPASVASLYFGGDPSSRANFEGRLDEIALYARTLSPEEIQAHFQAAALPAPIAASTIPQ